MSETMEGGAGSTVPVRRYAALAGVAAAAGGLAVGELVAAIIDSRSAPLVAIGGIVIDRVPESGKELAIQLFGTKDKLALQVGTVAVVLLIAAGLGLLARTRPRAADVGFLLLGAVGVAAALSRTGASVAWALPGIAAAAVAVVVVRWLSRALEGSGLDARGAAEEEPPQDGEGDVLREGGGRWPQDGEGTSRRRFVWGSTLAIGGGVILGYAGRLIGQSSTVNDAREEVRALLPTPLGGSAPTIPEADAGGLAYVTPNSEFYRIDTAIVVPRVDPNDWTLTIDGRVGQPLQLTFADLLRRPMVERYVTLACVSNEVGGTLIGNARWLGVPIADLLDEARPDPGADQVVSWSVDGFTAGTPTAVLRDGRDALLAVAMNGEPLPLEHGFPVRMVVPGLYGYVSATKWLRRLELTTFADFDAYWIPRGWAREAPIKTQSRIDRPRAGAQIEAGEYMVAGVAWAQHRGIREVEVRVDGGPWQQATLAAVASVDTWRLWTWRWQATAGEHRLQVRATDNAGMPQTAVVAPPIPDGATGYHEISVTVR